jgi:thiosulfate reductase cytochrome b subunit
MKTVYIYKSFERFWHWAQAFLIIFLAITGFEVHSSYSFFGYENAVIFHRFAAYALMILIVFAIFWHFTTGEWKQYIPTTDFLKAQVEYYLLGIFKDAPHPTRKTVLSKLNPLQRLTYLGLKLIMIPIVVVSGMFYIFYRYPQGDRIMGLNIESLETVAIIHTAGAFLLIAFVVVHIYLTTTGHTPLANLKAMMTGYEEIEDDDESSENSNKNKIENK